MSYVKSITNRPCVQPCYTYQELLKPSALHRTVKQARSTHIPPDSDDATTLHGVRSMQLLWTKMLHECNEVCELLAVTPMPCTTVTHLGVCVRASSNSSGTAFRARAKITVVAQHVSQR